MKRLITADAAANEPRATTKKGFSLVELLIAMGATTVLLGVSTGLVHRAMTACSELRRQERLEHEALRLSRQLRADLREARSADVADGRIAVTLNDGAAERVATYTLSEGRVQRELSGGAGPPHREAYRFPNTAITAAELDDPPRVELTVSQTGPARHEPARAVLRLESVVGSRLAIQTQRALPTERGPQ